ncbi:MAG: ABC transporter substrate-binding protein, partial [Oligoflexales bacterium]|nr:ABC transporter substrate-binding protein [Oligoflexales bacterium]
MRCFLAIAIMLTALTASAKEEKTYIFGSSAGWIPWGPINVANIKGFWKEQGLNVQVQERNEYNDTLNAVKQKRVDFVLIMFGNAIEMINEGSDLALLYEHDWSDGGDQFIVSNKIESTVKSGKDLGAALKGQKIGIYSINAATGYFLQRVTDKIGLKIKDVEQRQLSRPELLGKVLSNNTFAAAIIFDPIASQVVAEKKGVLKFTTADFPGVMPEGICVKKSLYNSMDKEDVVKFLKGWFKALAWVKDPANKAEYYKILNQTTLAVYGKKEGYSEAEILDLAKGGKVHYEKTAILERQKAIPEFTKGVINYMSA